MNLTWCLFLVKSINR